jgi:hypothetical protein
MIYDHVSLNQIVGFLSSDLRHCYDVQLPALPQS